MTLSIRKFFWFWLAVKFRCHQQNMFSYIGNGTRKKRESSSSFTSFSLNINTHTHTHFWTPPSHWTLTFFPPRSAFFIFIFYGLRSIKEINGKMCFSVLNVFFLSSSTTNILKFVPFLHGFCWCQFSFHRSRTSCARLYFVRDSHRKSA